MNAIVDKLVSRIERADAAALKVFRAAVVEAVAGQELGPKRLDELADALKVLELSPAQFDADVNTYRSYLAMKATADAFPSPEEASRAAVAASKRKLEIDDEIQRLKIESGTISADLMRRGYHEAAVRNAIGDIVTHNPRLFGTN